MPTRIVTVDNKADVIAALGPATGGTRSVILVGGADAASPEDLKQLRDFFRTLARYLDATGTAVVDGGTDSGVMRLIGEIREELGATFRLVGVAPRGTLVRPTRAGDPVNLAHYHPEILLVPGSSFGDETTYLFAAGDHLAGASAPTLVVNGGRLTMAEARARLDAGHPVVAVAGSGRAADDLAADTALRASGRLRVVGLTADVPTLAAALGEESST